MRKNLEGPVEKDLSTLLGEIAADVQSLISQQVEVIRLDLLAELQQAKTGVFSLSAGIGLVALSGILSTQMLVHLLHKSTRLPLWACYGMVAGLAGSIGAQLIQSGGKEISDLQLLPPPQTSQTLKENLMWLKQQTTTD